MKSPNKQRQREKKVFFKKKNKKIQPGISHMEHRTATDKGTHCSPTLSLVINRFYYFP
jgi:hypothetical protein